METTLIGIEEEYIATVNTGIMRWSHRKDGGHSGRIISGAYRKAQKALRRLGFNDHQVKHAIRDAKEMAELIRRTREE